MSLNTILDKYRQQSFSERDKGDRFERLMQAYLSTDPLYAAKFRHVWLWKDFFAKNELGGGDTGIDLVAMTHDGDYWAIQCKCYQEDASIDKPAVDSFLATSSREFTVQENRTAPFTHRLWISTTNHWSANATEAIKNQNPPVSCLSLANLQSAPVDWLKLDDGMSGEDARTAKKELREHQTTAVEQTHEYFQTAERGKLIMACGTGKTFTSLRIAERETGGNGFVLFFVPSIALLGQALREWSQNAIHPINAVCICSDPAITKKRTTKQNDDDTGTVSVVDLALPASTNVKQIVKQFEQIQEQKLPGMTVVFSTYQSLEVIAKAQKELLARDGSSFAESSFGEFDLIICDEAHRTTGVTLTGEEESAFVRVHDNEIIRAKKRLYMTATPRLYNDDSKSKAAQAEAVLCSMDDEKLYGQEIYRIGFGEAVDKGLLTDYKVLVLTVSESDISPALQKSIADKNSEINTDDAAKLIGCVNALSKLIIGDEGKTKAQDPAPMRRAVAFCRSIKDSKKITDIYNTFAAAYLSDLPAEKRAQMVRVQSDHIDGTMSAPQRDDKLVWLKADTESGTGADAGVCRMLTNVRCLSEGVDVPSLDAVLFLSARNSQVDVVQSVGRVMRRAPGKKFGYIIIPVVVPANVEAEKALDDNERYKVVWTVLNALKAHDDRFNALVNKIELNQKRPEKVVVGGVGAGAVDSDADGGAPQQRHDGSDNETASSNKNVASAGGRLADQMLLKFEELQTAIFARMVLKVGNRQYWEQWAKNIAEIAERQQERITRLVAEEGAHNKAFTRFLEGLRKNINPAVSDTEAIEMLAQHVITKPVFDALFEDYSFVKHNPISVSMQSMLDVLEAGAIEKDTATLEKFYESVRMRASGIDNAEGKQRIIIELYDKFFKTAFPKMVEKLGIVYTPVEVVDFIIHSVNDVLKKEFDRHITDENIHVLDPFTGTGTFITRLIQSGLIAPGDLERKYRTELHANEIVLLAYYIAAVNIENAFHDAKSNSPLLDKGGDEPQPSLRGEWGISGKAQESLIPRSPFVKGANEDTVQEAQESLIPRSPFVKGANEDEKENTVQEAPYQAFDGICLTDTFQLGETDEGAQLFSQMFEKNSERVLKQKNAPLRVIVGNPPYSVGQNSANDNAQNQKYDRLDERIAATYAAKTNATNKNSLYDSYFKAFRWSADRLGTEHGGIIAFVSNGSWLDGNAQDGFRQCLQEEFSAIYVFNLRGNQRTSGELSRKEGGKIFGSGSRASIAITILVKKPQATNDQATIHYHDIGDYLTREEKLHILKSFRSAGNPAIPWRELTPNEHGDWVSQRKDVFQIFMPLESEKKFSSGTKSVFTVNSRGCETTRDAWVYNSSQEQLNQTMQRMVEFFNSQVDAFAQARQTNPDLEASDFVDTNPQNISWSSSLLPNVERGNKAQFFQHHLRTAIYRPFFKQHLYWGDKMIHRRGQMEEFFSAGAENRVICVSGVGVTKDFSAIMTDTLPDLELIGKSQCFPLYYYEEQETEQDTLFGAERVTKRVRRDGVSDWVLERVRGQYGTTLITKEDIFHYVYGVLHSRDYRTAFGTDLKKMLPRLPLVRDVGDFWKFSNAGRKLGELHCGYESVPPAPEVNVEGEESEFFAVEKMRFPAKDRKDTIHFNSRIRVSDIPDKAYEYVVNGKSAIEWVMERYAVTTHKESGIRNDPNDWAAETGNKRYILDVLLSVIAVSVQTVDILEGLPRMEFEGE